MAQVDWTELTGSLSTSSIDRGPTKGIARPPGGGDFLYGFHSLSASVGAAGLFCNLTNFAPLAKGGIITGAIQRGPSGGATGFSPFLFIGCDAGGSPAVTDAGYLLGLGDGDPHHIVLRKGTLSGGLPDIAPGTQGVLRRSTATYAPGTWLHLMLEQVVNANGDVVLNCYQSDLALHDVTTPDWQPIPGMARFYDDALGVNSGSQPLLTGYAGFGMASANITRRAYFDYLTLSRQL